LNASFFPASPSLHPIPTLIPCCRSFHVIHPPSCSLPSRHPERTSTRLPTHFVGRRRRKWLFEGVPRLLPIGTMLGGEFPCSQPSPLTTNSSPILHRHTLRAPEDCQPADPADNVADRLNEALENGGRGYVLRLCPGARYLLQKPVRFSHPEQEISTVGYPTGDERATLVVSGPVANEEGHTVAVDGQCGDCDGVKLRNIQVQ